MVGWLIPDRLQAIWNILRGRPTAYRIQVRAGEKSGLKIENVSAYSPDSYAWLRYTEDDCVTIRGVGKRLEPDLFDQGFRARL